MPRHSRARRSAPRGSETIHARACVARAPAAASDAAPRAAPPPRFGAPGPRARAGPLARRVRS
eukprot:2234136-Alexandrium_andersonii.AAC.1